MRYIKLYEQFVKEKPEKKNIKTEIQKSLEYEKIEKQSEEKEDLDSHTPDELDRLKDTYNQEQP